MGGGNVELRITNFNVECQMTNYVFFNVELKITNYGIYFELRITGFSISN